MKKEPWLIQRCEARDNEDFTGFDSSFRSDYMGAAEFEFGALPQSLRRIVAQKYTAKATGTHAKDGRGLYSVCADDATHAEVAALVPELAARKIRLKEYSYLGEMLDGKNQYKEIVVWWDIQNDWFLALGEKMAKRVLATIDRQRDKWAGKAKE